MVAPTPSGRSGGVSSTSDSTTHAITLPAGINVGDLLLVFFTTDETPTVTCPGDWFKYGGVSVSTVANGSVFYKWATGSDTLTITTSSAQQSSHVSYCIPNGGVPSGASVTGTSTNSNPPASGVNVTEDCLVIASRHGDGTIVATVAPTNYTNLQTKAGGSSTGASTNTAERQITITAGGSENPGTFTSSSVGWISWTILIPPSINVTQTVIDNFSTALDTSKWDMSGADTGTTYNTTGGTLNLVTPAGSGGYITANYNSTISLQPAQFYGLKVVSWGSVTPASLESYPIQLYIHVPAGQTAPTADIKWNQAQFSISFNVDGATPQDLLGWNSVPVTAIWWGVGRDASGGLIWVYSADGVHWRRYATHAWPGTWNSNSAGYASIHGQYNVETNADTMSVDNFSLFVLSGGLPAAHVRRSGSTVTATATKVRRSSAWVVPTSIKVRRSGGWVTPS